MPRSGFDRSSGDTGRTRRMLQRMAATGGFKFGDGLDYDPANDEISIALSLDPGLEFNDGNLRIRLDSPSGLQVGSGGLSIDLDTNPGLVLGAGGIKVLVDAAGALALGAGGLSAKVAAAKGTAIAGNELSIDLRDTTPGLELAATGLGVLLDSNPGLVLTSGLKVQLNGSSLTLGASGLSVTAPEGAWSVTAVQTSAHNAAVGSLVRCDPSGGTFAVTLPTAVGNTGRRILVKNTTSSTTAITIDTTGGQTIDGAASVTITTGFGMRLLVSDGANWMLT